MTRAAAACLFPETTPPTDDARARAGRDPLSQVARSIPLVLTLLAFGCQESTSLPPDKRGVIQGRVVDDLGPVVGATVRWKTTSTETLTDGQGEFTLDIPSPPPSSNRITAAKPGYFIGGATRDHANHSSEPLVIQLRRLPEHDQSEYRWVAPIATDQDASEFACSHCHPRIVSEWQGTGHALGASNPFLVSLLEDSPGRPVQPAAPDAKAESEKTDFDWSLARELPHGVSVCASCHSPTSVAGIGHSPAISPHQSAASPANAALSTEHDTPDGVHCDFCHKISQVSLEHLGHSHGIFAMRLLRPTSGQLFFGPLDDVDRGDEAYSPLQTSSRLCASCHEGTLFGVSVYTTYREWRASPAGRAGQQCQSCHMTPTGHMTEMAQGEDAVPRRPATLASHQLFAGGLLSMLQRAIQVRVVPKRESDSAGKGAAVVASVSVVADQVGHRVPTGFIDRHLLLVVDAVTQEGQLVPCHAGPVLPLAAGKDEAGRAGRLFARQLVDPAGQSPAPFWRPGVVEREDSRLRPGEPVNADFHFVDRTGNEKIDHLRVRLLYRKFWRQVVDAKQWKADTLVIYDQRHKVAPGE